ncbi:mitochondrial inner membrane protease subunit 1-like isoform X2 [Hibiscus syriacus]|uniref:Mitochondrial inner membrane protease subunit 1-like isoform X2 n=1 Tax=Hibiscus syriacus TaxID=106335 RepID=A0A6A2YKN2_HIBSY|nr:mitochondrial inner membrane protease subunit 1-like isoform X2 [Hibiscus syriacus]
MENHGREAMARASISFACYTSPMPTYYRPTMSVLGPSMLPTLSITGDVVLVERLSHRLGKLGSGDLVRVRSPLDPNKTLTKRVVAMEGDKVPKGHVWIQGDNLYVSRDSRHFGPLPYGLIEGKVFMGVSNAKSIVSGFVHRMS